MLYGQNKMLQEQFKAYEEGMLMMTKAQEYIRKHISRTTVNEYGSPYSSTTKKLGT